MDLVSMTQLDRSSRNGIMRERSPGAVWPPLGRSDLCLPSGQSLAGEYGVTGVQPRLEEMSIVILLTLVVGALQTNCYLVGCERTHEAMIIDPGGDAERILASVRDLGVRVSHIVLTHFHFDHVLAVDPVRSETGAVLAIHESDAGYLAGPPVLFRFFTPRVPGDLVAGRLLHDGDLLSVGGIRAQVLHTPGHSPGGISLYVASEGVVFCGDTLFRDGLGRTDFPKCSRQTLMRSVRERLFALPDETVVYPGHGPDTTIGRERRYNPWVGMPGERG